MMKTRILILIVVSLGLVGLAMPADKSSDPKQSAPEQPPSADQMPKQVEAVNERLGKIEKQLNQLGKVLERMKDLSTTRTQGADEPDNLPTVPPRSDSAADLQVRLLKRDLNNMKLEMQRMRENMAGIVGMIPAEPPAGEETSPGLPLVPPGGAGNSATAQAAQAAAQQRIKEHSLKEIGFSISVLVFGMLIIGLVVYFVLKHRKEWDVWSVQIIILTLIIVPGAFLITAGYGQQQITPLVGLLGTVAGYLLGQKDPQTGQRSGGLVGGLMNPAAGGVHPPTPTAPAPQQPGVPAAAAAAPRPVQTGIQAASAPRTPAAAPVPGTTSAPATISAPQPAPPPAPSSPARPEPSSAPPAV